MASSQNQQLISDTLNDLDEYIIVWFDKHIDSIQQSLVHQIKFRAVLDYLQFYDDIDKCEQYIRKLKHQRVYFVIAVETGSSIVERLHDLRQVQSICLYKVNPYTSDPNWAIAKRKVQF